MVDADSPASDPKNPSSAGAKSPVERPRRYRTGNTSPTLGDRRGLLGKIYELNRCPSRRSLTRGARTLSAPAPVTSVAPQLCRCVPPGRYPRSSTNSSQDST